MIAESWQGSGFHHVDYNAIEQAGNSIDPLLAIVGLGDGFASTGILGKQPTSRISVRQVTKEFEKFLRRGLTFVTFVLNCGNN